MPMRMVSRREWGASNPKSSEPLATPVLRVVLHYHSDCDSCDDHNKCRMTIKKLQEVQQKRKGYPDIEHNFYIANDGMVYEGRGWTTVSLAGDTKVLHLAYMGNYDKARRVPEEMEKCLDALLELGAKLKHVKKHPQLKECRDPSTHPPFEPEDD